MDLVAKELRDIIGKLYIIGVGGHGILGEQLVAIPAIYVPDGHPAVVRFEKQLPTAHLSKKMVLLLGKIGSNEVIHFSCNGRGVMGDWTEKLSKEEVEEYRAIFSLVDKDGNGHIEASELEELLLQTGQDVTREQAEAMIAEMDVDQNGTIEFDEFLRMISSRDNLGNSEIAAAFAAMDVSGDGYITIQELRAAFKKLGEPISDADMHMMIRESDLDGDGRVSLEDFRQILFYQTPETDPENSAL